MPLRMNHDGLVVVGPELVCVGRKCGLGSVRFSAALPYRCREEGL